MMGAGIFDRIRSLASSVRDLGAEYSAIAAELDAARARRTWLEKAPRPKACLLAAVDRMLTDQYRVHFDAKVRELVARIQDSPCDKVVAELPGGFDALAPLTSKLPLTYLLEATLKSELHRAINAMDWRKDCGPPAGQRAVEKAQLDRKIEALEAELAQVRIDAEVAGVSLWK